MAALRLSALAAVFSVILVTGLAGKCGINHWQCDDGACILRSWRCDGAGDCLDGSDEMDCSCPSKDFECFDGTMCVIRAAVCDGLAQCPDGSDELDCNQGAGCLSGDWLCKNSICISLALQCNGVNDCGDNSDEDDCGPCSDLNLRCLNGTCLMLKEMCDGVAHCADRRDEPVTCGKMCSKKNGGCSHTCTDQLWGALCSCPSGMKISANGAKCEDIDECAQPFSTCPHMCINTKGSFKCKCHSGFKLEDGNVCRAQGNNTQILTTKKGLIGLVTLKNRTFKTLLVVDSDPVSLAYDIASNLIYWCDENGIIYKALGKKSTILYSGQGGIKSLTVDWFTGQLYWTNPKLKGIYTGASDGSAVGVVISKDTNPTDLVLLPSASAMFWINKGLNDAMTIERAGMDGSLRTSLAVVTAQLPKGLTLDVAAQRLYWISDFKMSIESVKVDGTGRHTFQDFFKGNAAQSLAAFNGWFYWSDDRRLWQAQQQSIEKSFVLKSALPILTVYHELQQPQGISPCRKSACKLCLPSPASEFTCSCSEGQLPVLSGSCATFKLAYATSESIYTLEYSTDGPVKSLLFSSTEDIQSFDIDLKRGWVIWTNGTGHVKARLPNQDHSEYISTPTPACTVRIDQKTGNLYWVSCDGLSIGATHITLPDQCISQQLYQASAEIYGLYVDWQRSQFYWLENGQIIKMKLGLLGGNAKAIYSTEKKTNHIVFDRKANSFLWNTQKELHVLSLLKMRKYSSMLISSMQGLIIASYEPYMVTLYNDVLTLWKRQDGTLVRAVAVEGGIVEVTVALNEFLQGLTLDALASPTQASCKSTSVLCNGTMLCISKSRLCDGKPDCPDGSDEDSCLQICAKPGDFQCMDRRKCIARDQVCNGQPDCSDGSDERDCPLTTVTPLKCRLSFKPCKDGRECVLYSHVCDGEVDCSDGSDENECVRSCRTDQFQCAHGQMCIDGKEVCDGTPQCQDRSDELDCFTHSQGCSHRCDKTRCIPESFLCDGERDCVDGTDEANCKPPSASTTVAPRYKTLTEPVCKSPSVLCEGTSLCISPSQLCDGSLDCPDGFDELHCLHACSDPGHFLCKDRRKCVERTLVCDGRSDCADGSDELQCPTCPLHCDEGTVCLAKGQYCDGRLDCMDGSDEQNCYQSKKAVKESSLKCPYGFKPCRDGSECILNSHVCDGEKDCKDGSDEKYCERKCKKDQFQCAHGRMCIDRKEVCDGTPQCQDRSDELDCFTHSQGCSHRCDKTRCIPESFLCDGERDCVDGTDEANCKPPSASTTVAPRYKTSTEPVCKSPSVPCEGTSLCISPSQLCDGLLDCPDGFDELHCLHACSDPGHFLCKDRRKCVERTLVCDGRSDCADGSDELQCPTCPLYCDEGTVCLTKGQYCGGRLDCMDGSDEQNCYQSKKAVKASSLKCPYGFKPCRDGSECILNSHVCDGEKDCKDGSDEKYCERKCKKGQFQCAHGKMCIDRKEVCDGTPQCQDRSDELDCFTRTKSCSHHCDDKTRCIPESFLCDKEKDCVDGSDEADCAKENTVDSNASLESTTVLSALTPTCRSPSVLCEGTTLCIFQNQLCDGQIDCPDGSDELSCVSSCTKMGDFLCKDRKKCIGRDLVCDKHLDCSDGSDEKDCSSPVMNPNPGPLICRMSSKLCKDGSDCVLYSHVCDGEVDCKDGSDEEGCDLQCNPDQFQCSLGRKCIERRQVCDGTPQCPDNSDEASCWKPTRSCALRCDQDSHCIPEVFICNGFKDCWDGSDEMDCGGSVGNSHCRNPSIPCLSTLQCISPGKLCDGRKDCADGSDERPCLQNCPYKGDFLCMDRRRCIERKLVCDGKLHCSDGSDEVNCPTKVSYTPEPVPSKCLLGLKPCKDGSDCILYSHVCDGEVDCKDGSDEEDCDGNCKAGEFLCAHGKKCIDARLVCDGKPHCQDRSDEMDCFTRTKSCSHRCDNKTRCIPEGFLCDGEKDCIDGTDEADCGYPTPLRSCESPSVLCRGGKLCLSSSQVCDGKRDCPDGFDEEFCLKRCSKTGDFLCKDRKKCVDVRLVCDGRPDCTDGSDEKSCPTVSAKPSAAAPLTCIFGWSPCKDGSECILHSHVCDGEADCKDASDEEECQHQCAPDQFHCAHGRMCIDKKEVCDGTPQCQDRSDEMDCFTRTKSCSHRCDNKTRCIPENFLCDGEKDCVDGTDEADCPAAAPTLKPHLVLTCKSPSVQCESTSLCISQSQMCDGTLDCPDGSDELHCLQACSNSGDFLCKNRRKCIEQTLICNGHSDCADGSDELKCPICSLYCDEGTVCLTKEQYCDGRLDCKDGSDERNCVKGETQLAGASSLKCRLGFKPCLDGSDCILYSHVCDGEKDCKDGSDEKDCERQCKKGQFQCAHGKMCIDRTEVCDGTPQCQDRSDELNCFKLSEGCSHVCDNRSHCIPETFLCDGERDCLDGTDETGCAKEPCSHGLFKCISGQCVSPSVRCDGHADCKDQSDEKHCRKPPHCPQDQRCPNSHVCLLTEWLCDEDEDCSDGSDEQNCKTPFLECGANQWSCTSKNQCIPMSWRCDHVKDCKDHSDETGCGKPKCPSHLFKCDGDECVDPRLVCNGISDCMDGSDEGSGCFSNNCSSQHRPTCEHYCVSTPQGARCGCQAGYELQADGFSCADIDECKNIQLPVCSHKCMNTHGSYACQCHPGFILEPDGSSCKTPVEPGLLASVQYELLYMGLRNRDLRVLLPPGQKPIFSLDYDGQDQRVFWVCLQEESIKYIVHGEKKIRTVVKGVKSDSVAVDWLAKNLYWVDALAGQILAVRIGDGVMKPANFIIVLDEDLEQPLSLVLLPQKGLMLWTEIGTESKIKKAGMDGSEVKVVFNHGLAWPVALAVDVVSDTIYWADEKLKCIGSVTMDGENMMLLQLAETLSPFSVAVFGDLVYWSDSQRMAIHAAHKVTGKNRKVILKRPGRPFGLKVVHPLMQPKVPNPCEKLQCSHMCVLAPGSQGSCRCPAGLLLDKNGFTCKPPENSSDSFLLLLSPTRLTLIFTGRLRGAVGIKQWPKHRAVALPGINEASLLDLVIGDKLYVADTSKASVAQFKMSDSEFIPDGYLLQLPEDPVTTLAVDWITHNLYWSSSKKPQIYVTSAGGNYTIMVVDLGFLDTSAIALHPPTGRLCFTAIVVFENEALPQVSCTTMDGRNPVVLWTRTKIPKFLTFSSQGTTLYWVDIADKMICSVDVDGSNYKEFKTETGSPLIMSLAQSDNIFFWSTHDNGTSKVWYGDGVQPKRLWFEVKTNIVFLKAYSKYSQKGTNLCTEINGGCSHLCLAYPGGRMCRCTQGYIAVNDTQCVFGTQCPTGTKPCSDLFKCISSTRFCDKIPDCLDGSDEDNCSALDSQLVRTQSGQSCDAELCNSRGRCVMRRGRPGCECMQGYSGQFCQDGGASSAPVVLAVLFIIGLVIVAAVVLKWRREKARGPSIDKETLMKEMEEQETHPENFSNELYNPVEEEEVTSVS